MPIYRLTAKHQDAVGADSTWLVHVEDVAESPPRSIGWRYRQCIGDAVEVVREIVGAGPGDIDRVQTVFELPSWVQFRLDRAVAARRSARLIRFDNGRQLAALGLGGDDVSLILGLAE
jgi:hypothetical protein